MNSHRKAANPRILFLSRNYPTRTFQSASTPVHQLVTPKWQILLQSAHLHVIHDHKRCSINNPGVIFQLDGLHLALDEKRQFLA